MSLRDAPEQSSALIREERVFVNFIVKTHITLFMRYSSAVSLQAFCYGRSLYAIDFFNTQVIKAFFSNKV